MKFTPCPICACSLYPSMELFDAAMDVWELSEDWHCDIPGKERYRLHIKKGYRTDGASIPRFAWTIVGHPLKGYLLRGALCHDGLYESKLLTKKRSDLALYDIIRLDGSGWWAGNTIYSSVAQFGGKAWRARGSKVMSALVSLGTIHVTMLASSITTPPVASHS